ncbi:hypothetical protein EAN86_03310 [Klebsiella pneumoniae]|nr:hypothetical protein EAN86_03310 [Klebsiella pneumoniae]
MIDYTGLEVRGWFMNPFTWLFIALLSVDAVRELMGLSSIMGMWCGPQATSHATISVADVSRCRSTARQGAAAR